MRLRCDCGWRALLQASDGLPSWLLGLPQVQLVVHAVAQTGATALDAIEATAGGAVITS